MLGQATKVWIVISNNENFIMKDSWVQSAYGASEVAHLQAMSSHDEVQGFVPIIVCGGNVMIDGRIDMTCTYCLNILGPVNHRHIHCCIVMSPVGDSITNFLSKKEFISVMIDIIQTHEYITNQVQILHHNISIGNVMLT
ncbi:hypothetical protein L208DRAFT_1335635 [Tricholoma matsutake]|nr:hypothetical protein L208DRAFT_1335635 [Tricholoma matsutake 945]